MVRKALKIFFGAVGVLALLFVVGLLWPSAAAPLPDQNRDYVLANAHVVDVERGTAGPPTSVTIRGGVISGIGIRPAGLPVVDGRGFWLLPGFWDMHMHSFQLSPQLHLPLFVAIGVTGARGTMDCPGETDSLIACVGEPGPKAPVRSFFASRALSWKQAHLPARRIAGRIEA